MTGPGRFVALALVAAAGLVGYQFNQPLHTIHHVDTLTSASGPLDHFVADAESVLGPSGFSGTQGKILADKQPLDDAFATMTDRAGDLARITWQQDNSGLLEAEPPTASLADGGRYSIDRAGSGEVAVVLYKDGRAIILSITPASPVPSRAGIFSDKSLLRMAQNLMAGT